MAAPVVWPGVFNTERINVPCPPGPGHVPLLSRLGGNTERADIARYELKNRRPIAGESVAICFESIHDPSTVPSDAAYDLTNRVGLKLFHYFLRSYLGAQLVPRASHPSYYSVCEDFLDWMTIFSHDSIPRFPYQQGPDVRDLGIADLLDGTEMLQKAG